MFKCIYCQCEILEKSSEHILHSALGSSLKSDKIICKECNNFFSNKDSGYIDNKFVEQFALVRNLLNIKGDRGSVPPTFKNIKNSDEIMQLNPGGKFVYSKSKRSIEKTELGKSELHISSPNIEKAKEQLAHLKKQYGDKATVTQSVIKNNYISEPIPFNLQLGGDDSSKGIVKILYNFFYYLKRDRKIKFNKINWNTTRDYLRNKIPSDSIHACLDYVNSIPVEISENDLSNYVFIFGSNQKRIIHGYVVIFGSFRFSAIINNEYTGDDFGYGIKQPINTNQITFFSDLADKNYNSFVTQNFSSNSNIHIKKTMDNFEKILKIYYEREVKEKINKITYNAVNKISTENRESKFTKEQLNKLASEIADEYVKWIYRIDSETPIKFDEK